jgi:ubiquinone/menaquinone biosynthesis C-methylase UbiE
MSILKESARQIFPPILFKLINSTRKLVNLKLSSQTPQHPPTEQDISVYWDSKMSNFLETWGEGNVWNEVQYLMSNCNGRVLDIACGTGKTIEINSKYSELEIYGCDISDFLLQKAIERGISKEKLQVCDATNTNYESNFFEYSYSIGSLEHFTVEGISQFIAECHRITAKSSFHMIPVSRSGKNEGWLKLYQSYHNNSVDWWLDIFKSIYSEVYVIDSVWHGDVSVGKWFICKKSNV